jgi:hypothetical protein
VLLVVDAATQHSYRPELDWLIYIGIPKCMTHVFQPADQLIIANLKKMSGDAYLKWIESTVATYPPDVAALLLAGRIQPPPAPNGGTPVWNKLSYKKYVKYMCLSGAVNSMTPATVRSSWAMAGILRAMWGTVAIHQSKGRQGLPVEVIFDQYVLALEDELELKDLEAYGIEEEERASAEVTLPAPILVLGPAAGPARPQPAARGKGRPPKPPRAKVASGPLDTLFARKRGREEVDGPKTESDDVGSTAYAEIDDDAVGGTTGGDAEIDELLEM